MYPATVEKPPKKKKKIKAKKGVNTDTSQSNMASPVLQNNMAGLPTSFDNIGSLSQSVQPHNISFLNGSPQQYYPQQQLQGFHGAPFQSMQPGHSLPAGPPSVPTWALEMGAKMDHMVKQLDKLNIIEHSVSTIKEEVKSLGQRVSEIEISQHVIGSMFEETKKSSSKMVSDCADLHKALYESRAETQMLTEDIIDLQCRSMRDNLLFFNIVEEDDEEKDEDCSAVIQDFCKDKLEITEPIELDRVHRMGKKKQGKIRPIIAKFRNYEQRDLVRKSSRKLKETNFSISEQFPKVVQERRKKLMPIFKKARLEGKKTALVRDRLYIGEKLYEGPHSYPGR